jgi:hypothetical protein
MTAPQVRIRHKEDVDRDIDSARRERGRILVQIEQYLTSVDALRSKYARAGGRIDNLLDERTRVSSQS